jgi:fatty acid amide hydrolase
MASAGRDELTALGAAEIARRIAAGDLSCRQVVEAHIRRIELVNRHAIICPPFALPAVPHGGYMAGVALSYSMLYNLLGMPAGVVAATRVRPGEESDRPRSRDVVEQAARAAEADSSGLPVGVQIVARHWREDVLLAVMAALEAHFAGRPDYPTDSP